MVRPAHLYKTDGTIKDVVPSNGKYFTLKELQDMVGGLIEFVYLPKSRCMVINEEGKIMQMDFNHYATYIYQVTLESEDVILGNALITDRKYLKGEEDGQD
jgi:hypothetical protein